MLQYFFFCPFFMGAFPTLYRLFLIIWTLHLLITWIPTWVSIPSDTPFSPLWVAATKTALFRGLLHINAARKVAAVHLMWWWQFFFRYFEFSSLSRVQGVYFNYLSINLVCVCRVRVGVPPRTFFPLSPTDKTCNVDQLSRVSLLGLVSVLGQGPRPKAQYIILDPSPPQ